LSGLGLMSASALAACKASLPWWPPSGTQLGDPNSKYWMLAQGTVNGTANWLVFQYIPAHDWYSAWALKSGAPTPPNPSQTTVLYDVQTWFAVPANKANFDLAKNATITIPYPPNPSVTIVTGAKGTFTSASPLFSYKLTTCTWNEIGT
jgi:hypothetical protein